MDKGRKKKSPEFWRFAAFIIVLFAIFVWLVSGLINLQLNSSEMYREKAEDTRTYTIALRGKRGTITTSDSVVMAQDEEIYNVTFQKDASQNSKAMYKIYTDSIIETIRIIEKNGGTMAISYVIERDPETGEWVFNFGSGVSETVIETRMKQWRSNNYATSKRYETAADCIEMFKTRYQIPDDVDEDMMLKIMAIYSEMQMNIFNSQPIVIAKDVRYETVIEIETRSMMLPGMSIEIGTKRVYPRSTLASQIIGYTGAIPTRAMWLTLSAKGYSYNDTIGRDGIESSMEDWLTQNSALRKGSKVVERDQMSRVVRVMSTTDPQDGNNVKLTLNASYQQVAERCMAANVNSTRDLQDSKLASSTWLEANKNDIHNRNWTRFPLTLAEHGCLIVLDMQCRVLAMANYPTYDLNALVAGGKDAMAILGDSRNLLLNYGIHARGTPGSIFKMVTAMGALATGELDVNERISDMGYYTVYNSDLSTAPKCWISKNYLYKHANQTIVEGLSHSCNYFFYTLADRLGEHRLYRYASLFGLTSKTGIDLPGEVRSVVGSQNTLYDPSKPVNEANQDTSLPIIVFNSIKTHLKNCGESRNIHYDDERLSVCAKRLMDMAVNYGEGEWLDNMRTILMEELNMTKDMVYKQSVIGDTYNYMNDIKWGGGQTILTGIGQSVTVLTPIAVARYVCTVANNGYLYNVSLIDSITSPEGEILSQREPTLIHRIERSDEFMGLIREGMAGVVDESGTAGKYFRNWPYQDQIAAKTGTAQVTKIDLENNSWFVCFAPYDNPEIAVACFIPNGYSGSEAAKAPRDFIEWYMEQKTLRSVDVILPVGNSLGP
ncbi:MAG: hypothetical protein K6E17_00655 [Clostridiales bacterium]|nr:hypothetical protein [Clostridiales bacterium]